MDSRLLSRFINAELDGLGFSKESVRKKAEIYRSRSKAKAEATKQILGCNYIEKIIVGSRIEGVAFDSSDTDVLQINHGIVCALDKADVCKERTDKLIVKAVSSGAPAGHVFLTISEEELNKVNIQSLASSLEVCLEQTSGERKLSGHKYIDRLKTEDFASLKRWQRELTQYTDRSGPAIPKILELLDVKADLVPAFPFVSKDLVRRWQMRIRSQDWPPKAVIEKSLKHQWYVVPVGKKESNMEEFQWRISFTETENELVHSMTDAQLKVFVLLRLIVKNILKPKSDAMSSYIVK